MVETRPSHLLDRDLPQHQAALTLIRDRLDDPAVSTFAWLDLGCGQGRILQAVDRVIPQHFRDKIRYVGVDISRDEALEAERLAKTLFPEAEIITSELVTFDSLLAQAAHFDAVTMTNTVHEISPQGLARILVAALSRVSEAGFFFIYDMERLPDLELGAVPWTPGEIERILRRLSECCGCDEPYPSVATWQHRSCNGWQVQMKRRAIPVSAAELTSRRVRIEQELTTTIADVLQFKLNVAHTALAALSRYGCSTDEERREAQRLAYDFWAISRSLKVVDRVGA